MAIVIKHSNPMHQPEELPEGVTLTPISSPFRNHYRVFAQNGDYPNRTELGTVKCVAGENYVVEVEYKKWAVAGFRVNQKSFGINHIKSVSEAINELYAHRLQLRKEGLIND